MSLPPRLSPDFPVVRDGEPVPARLSGAFVAIGNLDGVHLGHRAATDRAIALGRAAGAPAMALTFEPHPRNYFVPQEPAFRLTPEPAKLRLLAAAGLDGVVVLTFGAALAALPAEGFIADILVARLRVAGVVVGPDFGFGKDRGGDVRLLRKEGNRLGFAVEVIEHVLLDGRRVSSGAVREALAAGDIAGATRLLGHRWFVEGEVVRGAQRGRALGFPTANIRLDAGNGLRHGIYAVRVDHDGRMHDAVASFGRRPQFDNGAPLLEVMLLDFAGDLYGRALDVEFVDFIRPEAKFDSVAALQAEMTQDVARARAALAAARTGKR